MKRLLKGIIIALMAAAPLTAAGFYLFKTLDASDGLTISQINCVLKDSKGYVWLGTPAGLYRYDGYVLRNFQSNSKDGSSLPDSYIVSIQETLEHTLWIQTAQGPCIYHPQSESFERDMKPTYNQMSIDGTPDVVYIDSHKNIWASIPNKGVAAYNQQQQQHYEFSYTNDAQGIPMGKICSISECRDGALLVYEDGRIVCCDIMHQQHTVWQTSHIAQHRLRRSSTLKAFADQMDNIWLYGQGTLMLYHKSANTWNTGIGDQLGLTSNNSDRSVNGMAGDRKGNIWIATDRSGLIRTNVNNLQMEPVAIRRANDSQSLRENTAIQSVYIDDTDLLWVGTEKSGLAYHGTNIYKFESKLNGDITAITEDQDGNIWYGTGDKGLVGYDGPLSSYKVSAMTTTPDGSLWVGSKQNGLTRIRNGASTFYSARDSVKTLIDNHINALCTDKSGNLWIATNSGLQVYNPKMNTFSSYTRENGMLNTNTITSLYYGSNNRLLIGTSEGLVILNLSSRKKDMLTGNSSNLANFTNSYITQVFEDSKGLLWIGTREGLNILNPANDELSYLTEADGLCNNSICGIAEERSQDKNKNNCIWVTTSNGVSRIVAQRNHEDGTFSYGLYNYDTSDGLQSNEFNMGSILTRRDGSVLMGGLFGVSKVHTGNKDEQVSLPLVMLTQLLIGEEEVKTGMPYDGTVILPQALNESNSIELANANNTFTVKFGAGNYNQSERLQFMYWMEGLDNDWRNGDALLHGVRFKNLGSGKYKLHVKAVSADGATSNQERVLEIVIDRPWWLSWWMLSVYVIILILIIAVWKYGIKKANAVWRRKKTVIDELKRQREEIKQTSDELRAPMSRMTSIIGDLSMREQSVENREQLNSLHFQLLQIITRITEMQTTLEHPEKKAEASAKDKLELNDFGEVANDNITGTLLSIADIQPIRIEGQDSKFCIVFIDTNREFLQYINAHLREAYDFHIYDNIKDALPDIDTLSPDIVVCKQDMGGGLTGSDFCNQFKSDSHLRKTKFVLMTDGVLTEADMVDQNITLAADDYLAKPFNVHEAVMRFNKVLGMAPIEITQNVIEGKETRMLEGQNASMTTATMSYEELTGAIPGKADAQEAAEATADKADKAGSPMEQGRQAAPENMLAKYYDGQTIGDYSMSNLMDQQLMRNVEQFVLQNMSRGQLSLEEMATAMGMGRVPFFHKIRNITSKTPAEVVREIRLKHACTLLASTNINMSELAINVGFMTAENFINIFRDKFGMTPLEYRLKNKR